MDTKLKILQLKVLLVILEILLVLLIWTLVQMVLKQGEEAKQYRAKPTATEAPAEPTEIPFELTNFDTIRVVITNKEDGSISHEKAERWKECTD